MAVKYVDNFEFPAEAGFTGSATNRRTVPVRGHERRKPVRKPRDFAMGGPVKARRGGSVKEK